MHLSQETGIRAPSRGRRFAPARAVLALAPLAACALLGAPRASAANPQPYQVDWVPSGDGTIDSTMKLTSQLETLRTAAPVDPYGLIARARGDVGRLRTVLESFGYYQGRIAITINGMALDSAGLGDALTALPKSSSARVKIRPTLGPLFHVGRIDIKGALPKGMEKALGLKPGAPAVASEVLAAGMRLQDALQDAGYAFAKVRKPVAYEVPQQHILNLVFQVKTGERVRIGGIRIEGLKAVHPALLRRRLLVHSGELYDAATVERARQDLLALGLFSTVSVRLGKPDPAGRVPITFTVAESRRHTVGLSAAYSSDLGGSAGVHWSDRNAFGNGERLEVSAQAINLGGTASTGLGYDARIGYSIPDFKRRGQTLGFSVRGLRQALQAYTQTGETLGTTLSRKLSARWQASAGLAYEHEIIDQESQHYDYDLLSLPLAARFDSTDLASPLLDPTHGFRISLNVSPTLSRGAPTASSGVTNQVFIILQGTLATYYDLHRLLPSDPAGRTVIAARLMAGVAVGASQFSLPPDQRFYAGGSGTVRGYRYQSVGPEFADGNPTGGTNMQALNLELRQRVGRNFGIVAFVDAGGVSSASCRGTGASSSSCGGVSRASGGVYRVGMGTGVRYYTSIGPIRFDVALPVHRRPNDDRFEVYIGLGQAF